MKVVAIKRLLACNLTEKAFKQFVEQTFYSEPIKRDAPNNQLNVKESEAGTLYTTRDKQNIFLKPNENHEWVLEINHKQQSQSFTSFQDAERYIKRRFGAWLNFDDKFEEYVKK